MIKLSFDVYVICNALGDHPLQFQSSFSLDKDSEVDNSGTDSVNTLGKFDTTFKKFIYGYNCKAIK